MAVFVADIRIGRDRKGLFIVTRRPPASCPTFRLVGMVLRVRDLGSDAVRCRDVGKRPREGLPGQSDPQREPCRRARDRRERRDRAIGLPAAGQCQRRDRRPVPADPGQQHRLRRAARRPPARRPRAAATALGEHRQCGHRARHLDRDFGQRRDRHRRRVPARRARRTVGHDDRAAAGPASGGSSARRPRTRATAQTITSRRTVRTTYLPSTASLTVSQTIFNGFQTDNLTRRAESNVYSQRETLRYTELTVLYNAVQAYMNVLSNTATLELNRNNVEVLEEQLRQTRDRFNVGEVTRTDVAQAEARLAGARSQVSAAESALRTSIGIYRQNIGVEPRQLAPGRPAGPLRAGEPRRGHRHRPARASADRLGHPRGRCGRGAGEGAGGPAGAAA